MRLSETDASCETPITSFDASLPMNARTETAAPPLDQLTQAPASFMADGAYDRTATYDAILARNSFARFIVPPCKGAVPGPTATISPTQRDLHILAMDEQGRMNWQKASGYNKRSKVEAAIGRYKRVIGDALNSRHDARRATEVAIAVKSLNRMREFGQAKFVASLEGYRLNAPTRHSRPPCNKLTLRQLCPARNNGRRNPSAWRSPLRSVLVALQTTNPGWATLGNTGASDTQVLSLLDRQRDNGGLLPAVRGALVSALVAFRSRQYRSGRHFFPRAGGHRRNHHAELWVLQRRTRHRSGVTLHLCHGLSYSLLFQ